MTRRVAIVGAGLAGVTTAFELASLGWDVRVFERHGSVAEQASFAGCALLMPPIALNSTPTAPLAWRWRRWRAAKRHATPWPLLAALSQLSQERTAVLRRTLGIDDEFADGVLVALTEGRQLEAAQASLEEWKGLGLQAALLEPDAARKLEPGLTPEAKLLGAISFAAAGTGNGRRFAQQLRLQAQRLGARFSFHTSVRAIAGSAGALTLRHEYTPPTEAPATRAGAERDAGDTVPQPPGPQDENFDAVVLCNGRDAAALLGRSLGLRLAALHEACVTAPLRTVEGYPNLGPKAGLLDLQRGLAIARIGQRIRVTGGMTITSAGAGLLPDHEALHRGLQHWYPGSVLHQQVQQGVSVRPVVVDGLPLLGASAVPGVWLHLPSAGQGWGLACGSAQLLAQQIAGRTPALDFAALSPQRAS